MSAFVVLARAPAATVCARDVGMSVKADAGVAAGVRASTGAARLPWLGAVCWPSRRERAVGRYRHTCRQINVGRNDTVENEFHNRQRVCGPPPSGVQDGDRYFRATAATSH